MKKDDFFRVGTKYYYKTIVPTVDGEDEVILLWNYKCLVIDIGINAANDIIVYKKFICVPSHNNYQQVIKQCYNQYKKLNHVPVAGNCKYTLTFLKHIFGNQIELGLDYLKIIYTFPKQVLPILCLVSKERNTGKTTFLKWMKLIYETNAVYLEDNSFTSTHNSDWVQKLLICLDEVQFKTRSEVDKLKRLSTADKFMSRAMFTDKVEIDFFGKFILCSNHETDFIPIDEGEIRFWVRKISPLNDSEHTIKLRGVSSSASLDLLELLKQEIPQFLNLLLSRQYSVPKTTRMWFEPKDLYTEQLGIVIASSQSGIEKDVVILLHTAMVELECNSICFTARDLYSILRSNGSKYPLEKCVDLIRESWKVSSKNSMYNRVLLDHENKFSIIKTKGRFFRLERSFLETKYKTWLNC